MEYWDVCDQEGNRSGQTRPKGSAFAPGEYHPAMEAWIVNSRVGINHRAHAGR